MRHLRRGRLLAGEAMTTRAATMTMGAMGAATTGVTHTD